MIKFFFEETTFCVMYVFMFYLHVYTNLTSFLQATVT